MESDPSSQLQTKIRGLLFERFPTAESLMLTDEANLLESGAVDSLGLLAVVDMLEMNFNITVQDQEIIMDNFGTIRSLAKYVQEKQNA